MLSRGEFKGIVNGFSKPLILGEVPAITRFLSFKVKKYGGIKLYFAPTGLGPIGAAEAQKKLDEL